MTPRELHAALIRPDFVAHRRGILTRQMIEREWHRRSVPMLAYEIDADLREDRTHDAR